MTDCEHACMGLADCDGLGGRLPQSSVLVGLSSCSLSFLSALAANSSGDGAKNWQHTLALRVLLLEDISCTSVSMCTWSQN